MGGRGEWVVLVPVKDPALAKTRLRGAGGPGVAHDELVTALVLDTVAAARRCPEVAEVVLVGAGFPRITGVRTVPEPASDAPGGGGLNGALRHAAQQLPATPLAALLGDLPALDPAELAGALHAASTRCFVADADGTGTTLLAAPAGTPLDPHFGPGSAAAHRASGARPLDTGWPTLRRDVDTAPDLAAAARLGLGAYTATLLAGAGVH